MYQSLRRLLMFTLSAVLFITGLYVPISESTVNAAGLTYYVATTGNDTTGTGSISNPWKTVQKAANIANFGDTIIIRGGVYRESITPVYSGTSSNKITFKAYTGESVTISGLDVVTGWTQDSGSIYKASVAMSFGHENQVLYNGNMMFEARWPNTTIGSSGIWTPNLATAASNSTGVKLNDSTLPNYDWTGATVWIQDDPLWSTYTQIVTGYGNGYLNMSYASPWTNHDVSSGSKYYVSGVKAALDTDGEWYYSNGTLYAWVAGGSNPGSTVEVKKRKTAFNLAGKDHIVIENINIVGATIEFNESSDYITLDRLNIKYPYFSNLTLPVGSEIHLAQTDKGVVLRGTHHILKNSEISWSSGSGLVMQGSNFDVINNYIHDHDFMGSYASPLEIGRATNASNQFYINNKGHVISHNTITNAGRAALSYQGMYDSLIQYNDISHAGKLTLDLGLTYGNIVEGGNSEFRYNWLHDNDAKSHNKGLYYDHATHNILNHHNVIWGVEDGITVNHYALGMAFYNNTITASNLGFRSLWGNQWPDDMYGSKFINNVMNKGISTDGTEIEISHNTTNYSNIVNYKYLPSGSPAIDAGKLESPITDGYIGSAPDRGAYEYAGTNWQAGHNFSGYPTVDRTRSNFNSTFALRNPQ